MALHVNGSRAPKTLREDSVRISADVAIVKESSVREISCLLLSGKRRLKLEKSDAVENVTFQIQKKTTTREQ